MSEPVALAAIRSIDAWRRAIDVEQRAGRFADLCDSFGDHIRGTRRVLRRRVAASERQP